MHKGCRGDCLRNANPGLVTLPQYFRQAGYYTAAYGKIFHEGSDQQSFNDSFYGECDVWLCMPDRTAGLKKEGQAVVNGKS